MPIGTIQEMQQKSWIPPDMLANLGKLPTISYELTPQPQYRWKGRIVGFALAGGECVYLIDCPRCEHPQAVKASECSFG